MKHPEVKVLVRPTRCDHCTRRRTCHVAAKTWICRACSTRLAAECRRASADFAEKAKA